MILFELDEWQIRGDFVRKNTIRGIHVTCTENLPDDTEEASWFAYEASWFTDESPAVCIHCTISVPDEIQALVILMTCQI